MPGDQGRDVEHEIVLSKQSDREHLSPAHQSVSDPSDGVRRVAVRWLVGGVLFVGSLVVIGEVELDLV
jgi:hypothetical protein